MRKIVFDTSAILTQPTSGSFSAPDTELFVPEGVVYELTRGSTGFSETYSTLIQGMFNTGTVQIVKLAPEDLEIELSYGSPHLGGLSLVDREVLATALELKEEDPDSEVLIATSDRELERGGKALGLAIVSPKELTSLLMRGSQNEEVKAKAEAVVHYERKHLIISALAGAAITVLVGLVLTNFEAILKTFPIWGTLVAIPVTALLLFAFRARARLAYGLSECGVGFVAAGRVFWPTFQVPTFELAVVLQLLGGLYIMVRGLDNVGKALRGTSAGLRWEQWFPSGRGDA